MNQYIEALNKYVEQKELYGGGIKAESLMDVLFNCFCLENKVCIPAVSKAFQELDTILVKLSLDDNDQLFVRTCEISEGYRQEAFRTGLLVGFRLYKELADQKNL